MLTFGRYRFLLSRLAVGAVGVLVPSNAIGFPVEQALGDEPAHWTGGSAYQFVTGPDGLPTTPRGLPPGVSIGGYPGTSFRLEDPTLAQHVAALLPGAVTAALITILAWLVFILLGRVANGVPFAASSATTLRIMAVSAAAGAILAWLADSWSESVLNDAVGELYSPSADIPWIWFGLALLLFALAEVFAIGARLAEDAEGLV